MKKAQQLGMNPSTASGRLVKDLLFKFVIDSGHKCHRCGDDLTRDTFSIEHIKEWLDSDNPVGLYFDLSNIAFSHKTCNYAAKRTPHKKYFTTEERRKADTDGHRDRWQNLSKKEQQELRREKYRKHNC